MGKNIILAIYLILRDGCTKENIPKRPFQNEEVELDGTLVYD